MTIPDSFILSTPSDDACTPYKEDNLLKFVCDGRKRNGFDWYGVPEPFTRFVVDFGTDITICGVSYDSRHNPTVVSWHTANYVNEFEVLISDDNIVFTSIGTFKPDNIFSPSNSILQFASSITAKYMMFVVIEVGTQSHSMRIQVNLLKNCGTCPEGQFGCSNTNTGTASCIAGEPAPPAPPPPPVQEMACGAIDCGSSTCEFLCRNTWYCQIVL